MRFAAVAALLLFVGASPYSQAQLTIENPSHLQIPEQKATLLLNTACRVVAEKFRISNPSEHLLSMKLVLGSADEHYTSDSDKDAYTLFLERWDESKFTIAATNLAVQRFVIHDRLPALVAEVLQRTAQVAPVPVTELRRSTNPVQQLRGSQSPGQPAAGGMSGCLSDVTNSALRKIPCGPLSASGPAAMGARPR